MTTYDATPYPSYSYVNSDPARISAIAQLFGMVSPSLKSAKILEIGCASGGNILPLAVRYPDAEFIGVDLSKNQISLAQKTASTLSLENIRFIAGSIADTDFENQEFDYIIAHGVYSWVPEDIQNRILEVCSKHLSMSGVAYVSYNTLPGWNAVKTVRDMMLYHVDKFSDPAQKIREARNMLKFVAANIKSESGPYKETLEREIQTLQTAEDSYLLHEYLEEVNEPCYFHQFMEKAKSHQLGYLGDAELPSMYVGNQTQDVANTLSQLEDAVSQEQYMDFVTNRRFRMTLLVKESVQLTRKLSPDALQGLQFIPNFGLQKPMEEGAVKTVENLELFNVRNTKQTANLSGRILCIGYMQMLKAAPARLSLDEIVHAVSGILKDVPEASIHAELSGVFLKLLFSGVLSITAKTTSVGGKISTKPEVFIAARVAGLTKELVPSLQHENVKLTNDQRLILQYVNGQNTKAGIIKAVKGHLEKGELTLSANGVPMTAGSDALIKYLPEYVNAQLSFFAANALLAG